MDLNTSANRPSPPREVTVYIPPSLRYHLVYRQTREHPFVLPEKTGNGLVIYCRTVREALTNLSAIRKCWGMAGALKLLLKLLTPSRELYFIAQNGEIVHHGWVTLGRCRHYRVERESAVMGPIWSAPSVRGQGLGTVALQTAINVLVARGIRIFYTDTSDRNFSSQRMIQKSDFGLPVSVYIGGPHLQE